MSLGWLDRACDRARLAAMTIVRDRMPLTDLEATAIHAVVGRLVAR